MKSRDENLEKNLDRLLGQIGNPDPEQMEHRIESVAQSLRPIALGSREVTSSDCDPVEQLPQHNRRGRRITATVAAIAAMLIVALSTAVWRSKDVRPVAKSAEERAVGPVETLRLDGVKASVTTLTDGSRVEMRAGSEASVERASDGLRIHLKAGSIIVNAARQAPGRRLYVQTKDVTVSVVGTVFLVKADDKGSRVAVIEGAVRVQQGTVERNLQPGEQVSSNKEAEELALQVEIGWSREAAAYLALLHQSLAQKVAARQSSPRPAAISDKPQFEEASIRPCPQEFSAPQGMRGGGSNSLRLSPGRLDALCMTPATLIRTAYRNLDNNRKVGERLVLDMTYGLGMEDGTRVRGGPDWVRSEKYTIAAVAQGRADASTLGGPMLLALLESRFRLKVHVDTEEIPAWALKISESGLKIMPAEQGCFQVPPPAGPPDEARLRQLEEARGTKPFCNRSLQPLPPNMRIRVGGSMSQLAEMLSTASGYGSPLRILSTSLDGRLVLNRTGISDTEIFNFDVEFGADPDAWVEMQQLGFVPGALTLNPLTFKDPLGPTIFEALGKLGLTLERSKGSREFIVIDHIERPSPN